MTFLAELSFLGAGGHTGGLIRPDFLVGCVGSATAVFFEDCIDCWVTLEREDCLLAVFFVITEWGKTQHKNKIKVNDIIKVLSFYYSK